MENKEIILDTDELISLLIKRVADFDNGNCSAYDVLSILGELRRIFLERREDQGSYGK